MTSPMSAPHVSSPESCQHYIDGTKGIKINPDVIAANIERVCPAITFILCQEFDIAIDRPFNRCIGSIVKWIERQPYSDLDTGLWQ